MTPLLRRIAAGLLALAIAPAVAADQAAVERFSPEGSAKGVRQVVARFATPMVRFGDPAQAAPFAIDCAEPGRGLWLDTREWVFDFERDLPAGVRCRFATRADLKDVDGDAVASSTHAFDTGGPAVTTSMPQEGEWDRIDEHQVFLLGLDGEADAASVEKRAWCAVAGRPERIGVRVLAGKELRTVLEKRVDFLREFGQRFAIDSAERRAIKAREFERLPLVALQCRTRLPNDAAIDLVWDAGVASRSGVVTNERQTLAFKVRPAFVANFRCDRTNPKAGCIPVLDPRLDFTARVAVAQAAKIVLRDVASGRTWPAVIDADAKRDGWTESVRFKAPLPEAASFTVSLPDGLVDDAGRPLVNVKRFPLEVRTDPSPPLAKFAATFGVLELNADPALALTVRNVESSLTGRLAGVPAGAPAPLPAKALRIEDPKDVLAWLRRLQNAGAQWTDKGYVSSSIFDGVAGAKRLSVPRPGAERDFEVIGIPLREPGLWIVEVESPKLGQALLADAKPYYVAAGALVTNLAIHLKLGRESSLVWVTQLDSGKPQPGADVRIADCAGRVAFSGRTDASGLLRVKKALPDRNTLPGCREKWNKQWFVTARVGSDASFLLSDWNDGIATWRFNLPEGSWQGPVTAHTVFDRTLLRAGETVGMKHFVRRRVGSGFALQPTAALPTRAVIRHAASDDTWALPLSWDAAQGVAEAKWAIPKDAKLGTYRVSLVGGDGAARRVNGDDVGLDSGEFRVEAFRVPAVRATLQWPATSLIDATDASVGVQLAYLSGGAMAREPARLRGLVRPKSVQFADFDGFEFANGDVKEGRESDAPEPLFFDESDEADTSASRLPQARGADIVPLKVQSLTTDAGGAAQATLSGWPRSATPRELLAEIEYRDPNGETLTRAASTTLWPAKVLLGVRTEGWVLSKDRVRLKIAAVTTSGTPVANQPIRVDLFESVAYSTRKRLLGGFYAYESYSETKRIGEFCAGKTDAAGLLVCEAPVAVAGQLLLRARTDDADGRASVAFASAWVVGAEAWWADLSRDDRMDLLPERKRHEPGETARLQVRMPFREATALVTVEREGVLDAFVTPLSGKSPAVDVALKGSYAPNAFVSVLAVRGRVADPQPTALVDLAKPAFRLGIAKLDVGWKAHELAVRVVPDRDTFKVRDQARVTVEVTRADGGALPKGAEIALAAVDAALLELRPNESWKLLESMMAPRGIEVQTATTTLQVVGKRHFGRKAAAPGGGGGATSARELFDTLLAWRPRVKLDAQGRATLDVPLNDALSAFRIVAVASAGAAHFGTGAATVRTTQDVQLTSGLPPVVRDQDRFDALVTVRNATAAPLDLVVEATHVATLAAGGDAARGATEKLPARTVSLAAGAAAELAWTTRAPVGATGLAWTITARRADADAGSPGAVVDQVKVAQKVVAATPVRVVQATLMQVVPGDAAATTLPVARPQNALPGAGGLTVRWSDRLSGDLSGVREWMRAYPYSCLEQRASRAIALRDEALWNAVMADLPSYLDADGLAKYWPTMRDGSDTLSAYLLAISQEAGWPLPEPSRSRLQSGLVGFVTGTVRRSSELATADVTIRKVAALDALTRVDQTLDPAIATSIDLAPGLWPTSAVIDWAGTARRWTALPDGAERAAEAENVLRTRLAVRGTTLGFSTESSDALWWLMVSGDVNAARSVVALIDRPDWKTDLPGMVRGLVGRQRAGRWDTTVANAWGVLAMERFGEVFEREAPGGTSTAVLAAQRATHDWSAQPKGGSASFDWPRDAGAAGAAPTGATLALSHAGAGRPWATVQSRAALVLTEPLASGYRVTKRVTIEDGGNRKAPKRGDVLRVRLEVDAQADMTWVALTDPIPAGSTVLGSGLGGDSEIGRATGNDGVRAGRVWPIFEERSFEAWRGYYHYVPKGRFAVEYRVRLNNPGTYVLPPTRIEAMYAPEVFGELPNAVVEVGR